MSVSVPPKGRAGLMQEVEFTDRDFEKICKLIYSHTGISLSEHKRDLVYGRLSKRLRVHGLKRFCEYTDLIEKRPQKELEHFINAITTNLTSFFRENHHFEYLRNELVPVLMENYRLNGRLRFWSAGCSTGEEPYSLAITLRESIPDIDRYDIKILATDLDSDVLKKASSGVYSMDRIASLDPGIKKRWFKTSKSGTPDEIHVADEVRKLISFRQLNLMQKKWPMRGLFDVIFCRNVVIYFDKPTQRVLFDRFANYMRPESRLITGHSESLHNVSDRFELLKNTVYTRIC